MNWCISLSACLLFAGTASAVGQDSCVGRCVDFGVDNSKDCQCNLACVTYSDCCDDYQALCVESCDGRCDDPLDNSRSCQCNWSCVDYEDCCHDYDELCNGGGSTTVTDDDLANIAIELMANDVNKATSPTDYTIDFQGLTTSEATDDRAGGNLFWVSPDLLQRPIYKAFVDILDNYILHTETAEDLSSAEWGEIDTFLSLIIGTSVIKSCRTFLESKGLVGSSDAEFIALMKSLWFDLYPRSSNTPLPDSSGFEHVFVGELKSSSITGFHGWIQFHMEESKGHLDYKGWVVRAEPDIIGTRFVWHGLSKTLGSFFYGASPEFEMAIYSICALTRKNSVCPLLFTGLSFPLEIQTYDVSHKAGDQMATSYPKI